MKRLFFTPGPSQLYHTTEEHLKNALKSQLASISHRSREFSSHYAHTEDMLRQLLNVPETHRILFLSSATEIWERIIQNCVTTTSLHYTYGAFSKRFLKTAQDYGINAKEIAYGTTEKPILAAKDIRTQHELIAITQNETSTGLSIPSKEIAALATTTNAQIAIDAVSGLPYYEPDFTYTDHLYFSVQKGFGLPAGLGVWIVSQKAVDAYEKKKQTVGYCGSHHSLGELLEKAEKHQNASTPNVLSIYLLGKIAEDMLAKGLHTIRKETEYKSAVLYQAIAASPILETAINYEENRSKTVIVANTDVVSSKIIDGLRKTGLEIGAGYGSFKNDQIRVANFPAHSKEQVEMLADRLIALKF